jgi:hypothetical protein
MPTTVEMTTTAYIYRGNSQFLEKSLTGMTDEEWMRRPCDTANPVVWIVGHLIWARSRGLKLMGVEWSRPWLKQFERGSEIADLDQYPSPEELKADWKDIDAHYAAALEGMSAEALAAPMPNPSPSFDGSVGGMIAFLAFHESQHVGQVTYIARWCGHGRING